MFIRIFLFFFTLLCLEPFVHANADFNLVITNNKNLQERLMFFDKLYGCIPHKYHAQPSGYYEIYGKNNNFCSVRWTIAYCTFPPNVYQKFAEVQKRRTINKFDREAKGLKMDSNDKDYRYLYETGNKYCILKY